MTLKEWFMALLGHTSAEDDPARTTLDAQQDQIASRLARMTGRSRDQVLAEAYRRADRIVAGKR